MLFATLLVMSGCAADLVLDQDDALAVVPYRISDSGHIVVETMLNGYGPFEFALDTGASISAIFDSVRKKAAITPVDDATVHVLGIAGSGHFPVASASIKVGSEEWRDARVAILSGTAAPAQFDGVLGVDFLGRYAVWFSQRDHVVRLYARELVSERAYFDWNSIPLFDLGVADGDATLFAFDMFIDDKRISTLFDLGTKRKPDEQAHGEAARYSNPTGPATSPTSGV